MVGAIGYGIKTYMDVEDDFDDIRLGKALSGNIGDAIDMSMNKSEFIRGETLDRISGQVDPVMDYLGNEFNEFAGAMKHYGIKTIEELEAFGKQLSAKAGMVYDDVSGQVRTIGGAVLSKVMVDDIIAGKDINDLVPDATPDMTAEDAEKFEATARRWAALPETEKEAYRAYLKYSSQAVGK